MTRWTMVNASPHLLDLGLELWAAGDLAHHHRDQGRVVPPGAKQDLGDALELLAGGLVGCFDRPEAIEQLAEVLPEDGLEHLFLGPEVVVEEAVSDPRLGRDVADPCAVVAAPGEDAHGGVEDELPLLFLGY